MDMLTKATLANFFERFIGLDDAVLRRIEYCYLPSGDRKAIVTLSVQDRIEARGWSNLVLVIENASEFVLREGRSTCQVLSDGLKVKWFDDIVFTAFSPWTSDPTSIEEFRESDFYVAGRSCLWKVEPYCEE